METQIIGEGSLNLRDVAKAIETSASFAQLLRKWRLFGEELGLKDEVLDGLQRKLSNETYEADDLPRQMLKIWKANKGSSATLQKLCDALEDCRVRDIAESLSKKFIQAESEQVKSHQFLVHGKLYTLEKLVGNNASAEVVQAFERLKSGNSDRIIPLVKEGVSPQDQPEYYISRTFLFRCKLDEKLFKDDSTKEHIFVFKGASKSKLAQVCGMEIIESSGSQLNKLKARFILFECDDDFDKICANIAKPIHLIEHRDNGFYWTCSTKSLEVIRKFLKDSGNTFNEEELLSRILSLRSPFALSIADSPGMGKSFVLANLTLQIKETCPNSIVFFVVLQEFVRQIPLLEPSSGFDSILSFACTSYDKKLILKEILTRNTFQFFLLFDGYDEVLKDKLHLVDSLLEALTQISNVKVIVTTRPHMVPQLQNILKTLSFEIQAFDEDNQISFLTKYWITKHGAKEGKTLEAFAKNCLDNLKMKMTDKERDVAGIPLQCMMLAEVYAKNAKRVSELDILPDDAMEEISFFQMYKALIDLKFSKVADSVRRKTYIEFHIRESIALLYPDGLEDFKIHLTDECNDCNDIDESTLFSIGLVERGPQSSTLRFVHRTFAEYMVADFIVCNVGKHEIFVDILVQKILREGWVQDLDHPVVAYFVDMHLQDRLKENHPNKIAHLINRQNISNEYACDVAWACSACCKNGLESTFDLMISIIKKSGINDNDFKNVYFKHLPHIVVSNTNNVSFLQNVWNFTKSEFGANFMDHIQFNDFMFNGRLQIPNCTPLHIAVDKGNYNIVMFLLQEYGQDVFSIKNLLHVCVCDSIDDDESVIDEKISIIQVLIQLNKEWLEEKFNGRSPVLQINVHIKILEHLVKLGANINAYSTAYGTILQTMIEDNDDDDNDDAVGFLNRLKWALNNGFNLVNHENFEGLTPLLKAIEKYGAFDDEVLRQLHEAGADFNRQDKNGYSVLFYAIKFSRNLHFIQKLLDFGANSNHTNIFGCNAAHIIIFYESNPHLILEELKLLKSKGFHGLDKFDINGRTPLMLAIKEGTTLNDDILQFFYEEKVKFNAQDNHKNSVLFYAIEFSKDLNFIEKILQFGGNPNHKNLFEQNAAHLTFECYENDPVLVVEVLKLLKAKGFDGFNSEDVFGGTPFMTATQIKGVLEDEILQFLCKEVDFNAQDNDGNSVLFYAIQHSKDIHFIQKILENGANPNHKNKFGKNAAHLTLECHKNDPIFVVEVLKRLKASGFDGFNEKDDCGCTPIMTATRSNGIVDDEILQFLFQEGVDFHAQDNNRFSVLYYAITFAESLDFIQKILNFRALDASPK